MILLCIILIFFVPSLSLENSFKAHFIHLEGVCHVENEPQCLIIHFIFFLCTDEDTYFFRWHAVKFLSWLKSTQEEVTLSSLLIDLRVYVCLTKSKLCDLFFCLILHSQLYFLILCCCLKCVRRYTQRLSCKRRHSSILAVFIIIFTFHIYSSQSFPLPSFPSEHGLPIQRETKSETSHHVISPNKCPTPPPPRGFSETPGPQSTPAVFGGGGGGVRD